MKVKTRIALETNDAGKIKHAFTQAMTTEKYGDEQFAVCLDTLSHDLTLLVNSAFETGREFERKHSES